MREISSSFSLPFRSYSISSIPCLFPKQTSLETEPLPQQLKTGQVLFRDVKINDCSPKGRRGGRGEVVGRRMRDRRGG